MIAHPHLETPPRAISPVEETVEKLHPFCRRPPIMAPNLNMSAYLRHEPENDEQKGIMEARMTPHSPGNLISAC
jgi:hypothetical protein